MIRPGKVIRRALHTRELERTIPPSWNYLLRHESRYICVRGRLTPFTPVPLFSLTNSQSHKATRRHLRLANHVFDRHVVRRIYSTTSQRNWIPCFPRLPKANPSIHKYRILAFAKVLFLLPHCDYFRRGADCRQKIAVERFTTLR